jgi:hypothetical protein
MLEFNYIRAKYDFKRDIQYVENANGGIIISHGTKKGKLKYKNRVLYFLKLNSSWNLACCYPSRVKKNFPKEFKNRILLPDGDNSNFIVCITYYAIDRKITLESVKSIETNLV